MSIPAAWHPDPTGRHEYRYWDGQRWTEHVANAGLRTADPLDGRPAAQHTQAVQDTQADAAATVQHPAVTPAVSPGVSVTSSSVTSTADSPAALPEQEPSGQEPRDLTDAPERAGTSSADTDPPTDQTTRIDAAGEQVTPLPHQPDITGTAQSDDAPPVHAVHASDPHLLLAPHLPATATPSGDDSVEAPSAATMEPATEPATEPALAGSTSTGSDAPVESAGDPSAPAFQAVDQLPSDGASRDVAATSADTASARRQPDEDPGDRRDALGNGPAVAALIIGTVSVLLALVPFVGIIAVLLGFVAVILGLIGRRRGRRSGVGRGTATTGLATGAVGMVLAIAITAVFVTVVRESAFGVTELAACIDQGIDARTCSQRFEQAFFDQLFRR